MIARALALLMACAAIAAAHPAPPERFVTGALRRGAPVVTPGFVGLEWRCARPYRDETCRAGLSGGRLVTGP